MDEDAERFRKALEKTGNKVSAAEVGHGHDAALRGRRGPADAGGRAGRAAGGPAAAAGRIGERWRATSGR